MTIHFVKKIPNGDTKLRDVCGECGFISYKNPRVIVGAVSATPAGNIELIERDGRLTLPYDFMRFGETSKEAAARQAVGSAEHLLSFDEVPDAGIVVMTHRVQIQEAGTGHLFTPEAAMREVADQPAALHALNVFVNNIGKPRFSPGIMTHAFDKARLHLPDERILEPLKPCQGCDFDKGPTVKIVSGVLPIWQDKIMLARRAIEPRKGWWTLPAGFLEMNESLRAGAMREAKEETGADVSADELLVIYEIPKIGQVMTIFRGRMQSAAIEAGAESQDVQLFRWDEIPWSELAFPMVEEALNKHNRYRDARIIAPCHMLLTPVAPGQPPAPGVVL